MRTTNHGYPIVASKADGEGHEIIIAHREGHPAHPYVTWRMRPNGDCAHGDYCQTLHEAELSLNRRAGRA
jgi:hypothetical protein